MANYTNCRLNELNYNYTFVECDEHLYLVSPRILPTGVKYTSGPDWFTISRDLVQYLVYHQNESPLKEFLDIFKFTILSAERFFLAIVKNSHFCTTHVDMALRSINWHRQRDQFGKKMLGCHSHRPSVDWFGGENSPPESTFGCSPLALRMHNWNNISSEMSDPKKFLIRKFDSTIDHSVLNKIDAMVYGIDNMPDNKFWQNIWHHK